MLYIFIKIFSDFFNLRFYFFLFLFLSLPPPITEPEDPEHKIKRIWPRHKNFGDPLPATPVIRQTKYHLLGFYLNTL